MRNLILLTLVSFLFASCASLPDTTPPADVVTVTERLVDAIPQLISNHGVAGVGVAIIDDGAVAWTGYYGERAAGEAVTADTMFNTASLAKTVTAEVVLRLVDAGRVSLDEPIAGHWSEKDLADDPRYRHLTPRILLSHRSGLLNWPYAYDDGKLAFIAEPGEKLTYSGAGYEMLVHFVEAKLGRDFESLAREVLYEPVGLKQISLSRQEWIDAYITHSMDRSGVYHEPYTYPNVRWVKPVGYLDGADDLYVSVEDYARFLIAVMNGDGLEEELTSDRFRVISDARGVEGWACLLPPDRCPSPYGYGLGWTIFAYGNRTFVQHGGTDFGEHAMAYFVPETRAGVLIFVNGGNGVELALEILDLLEADHPLASHFRARIAR
ncbi:MAG: beta-lactamase family protein [Acidobacteria bacterium]|nr:beta-lactamase family protein [Acidobacteriota bacterium]